MRFKGLPLRGQAQLPALLEKQLHAQLLLQQLDVLEQRRGRILQLVSRLLIIEGFGQRHERRQLLHVHV